MATVVKKAPKKAPAKATAKKSAPVKVVAKKAPAKPRKKPVKVAAPEMPKVADGDIIVLRSQHGEQSFTGNELATAQKMADDYVARGWRVSLLLYTNRPENKDNVYLLYAKSPARKVYTDEVQSEVA